MAVQAWVVDTSDFAVTLQEPSDFHGPVVLLLNPQRQRLQSSDEQVCRVRVRSGAYDVPELLDGSYESRGTGNGAGHQIVVAAEVFRGAVQDEIDAEVEGTLIDRGREGAVDQSLDAPLPRKGGELTEVDDVEMRIGGRFREDDPCVVSHCRLERCEIASLDNRSLDTKLGDQVAQLHCAAVAILP